MATNKTVREKMTRNIARAIKRLGACSGKIAEYKRFGDDFEAAMRHANSDDVNWMIGRLEIPKSMTVFVPRECRSIGCVVDEPRHRVRFYSARRKRDILRAVWAGRTLRAR